jgi:choline monooxygenase
VGHAGQIPKTGFFTSSAGQIPVLVTRARDGELRAFINVCRHRGHIVASGSGTRETLQCPYHAWTYALDGRLRTAPRSDREPGFDTEELELRQIQVDTFGPFVFVNPDPDAAPLAGALGDVPAQLAEILDVNALEFRFRAEFELEANWKISCENFLECYHCAVAHPGFSAVVDVSPDAYRLEANGLVSSQVGPLRQNGNSLFGDGEVPRSQFDYIFAPGVDQAWIDELLAFDNQVGMEDRGLVEGVQRGVRSGILSEGRLLSESEQLVAHFQRLCAEALAG